MSMIIITCMQGRLKMCIINIILKFILKFNGALNSFYRLHSSKLTTTLLQRDFVIHLLAFDQDQDITRELFCGLLLGTQFIILVNHLSIMEC